MKYIDADQLKAEIDWLKSLRPQPKNRDTYYDIIHNILAMLKDMDFTQITPEHRVSLLNDIRVKCKDADECAVILDEPSWKPSEEQMKALKCAVEDVAKFSKRGGRQVEFENEPYYSALHSLYCNLEKLM